ncbi:MAG: DUF2490 domain-containing protein [Nitrosospira sp.]
MTLVNQAPRRKQRGINCAFIIRRLSASFRPKGRRIIPVEIKASIPLSFAPGYSYIIQDKAFVSLNDIDWIPRRGFDQNRFFTGIGYASTKNISAEARYMNQCIIRRGANLMEHDMVVNLFLNY